MTIFFFNGYALTSFTSTILVITFIFFLQKQIPPPGRFEPVLWDKPWSDEDNVLQVPNELVVKCILKLKNSSVPDNIKPATIKLLFGGIDLVNPLGELIRAVVRTRVFPKGGKIARQIFCWKGVGVRNNLDNCRTITMANIILKLSELCIKSSASAF